MGMLGKTIMAAAAICLAAMWMSHSQMGMRSATAALGITSSGKKHAYSFWDYNPLTLLSKGRLEKALKESAEASKFEKPKLPFDDMDFDFSGFNTTRIEIRRR
jgi:hypothetical protein